MLCDYQSNMRYDWILFDADNTLFDFNTASERAFGALVEDLNLTGSNLYEKYEECNHQCWKELEDGVIDQLELRAKRFRLFFDLYGLKIDALTANEYYLNQLVVNSQLIPGARDLISDLASAKYKMGIITNGLKEVQRPRLRKVELYKQFDVIVVSDEIGFSKPDARFFDKVFEDMGKAQKDRVAVVGDSLNSDIQGGNNYGLDTIWYNPNQELNNTQHKPNVIIENLNELKKHI